MYNFKLDRKIKKLKKLSKKLIELFNETIDMQANEFIYGNNFKILNCNYGNVHVLKQFEDLRLTANVPYSELELEATKLREESKENKAKYSKESEAWLKKNCLKDGIKIRALTFEDIQAAFDAGVSFGKNTECQGEK